MTRSAAPLDQIISDSLNEEDALLMRKLLPAKGRGLALSEHHVEQLLGPRDAPKVMPEPLLRALELAAARTGGTPWSDMVAFLILIVTIALTSTFNVAAASGGADAVWMGVVTFVLLLLVAFFVIGRQSTASHHERVIHRLQVRRLEDELAAATASATGDGEAEPVDFGATVPLERTAGEAGLPIVLEAGGRECRRARVRRSRAARRGR